MLPKFPTFVPLNLEDKEKYNTIIADHPPYTDFLFATLHIWWNLGDQLSISSTHKNLVINYYQPFDKENTGLCLIGKEKIDESIKDIFEYLKKENKPIRLIHVPEFVIKNIIDKKNLIIKEEKDYAEYILDTEQLSKLEGHKYYDLRYQVKRFMREVDGKPLEIRSLDLSLQNNKEEIKNYISKWEKENPTHNDPGHTEKLALEKSLSNAVDLELENIAVYIDGELYGIVIYHRPLKKEYYVLHHMKVSYNIPFISDYIYHQLAKKAQNEGVSLLNIEMDLGNEKLKRHKLRLSPVTFFKKYTISPK